MCKYSPYRGVMGCTAESEAKLSSLASSNHKSCGRLEYLTWPFASPTTVAINQFTIDIN